MVARAIMIGIFATIDESPRTGPGGTGLQGVTDSQLGNRFRPTKRYGGGRTQDLSPGLTNHRWMRGWRSSTLKKRELHPSTAAQVGTGHERTSVVFRPNEFSSRASHTNCRESITIRGLFQDA